MTILVKQSFGVRPITDQERKEFSVSPDDFLVVQSGNVRLAFVKDIDEAKQFLHEMYGVDGFEISIHA